MKQSVLSLFLAVFMVVCANAQTNVSLHPNPVEDRATLVFDQPITGDVLLTVRDLTGKTVFSFRPDTDGEDCFRVPMEMESLRRGIYILQVVFPNGKVKTLRFQKA